MRAMDEQRPADEDEIKRAEREDTPEPDERRRPATEDEIQEAEKERNRKDEWGNATGQREATEEEIKGAERGQD
jgi:hypothetical protein